MLTKNGKAALKITYSATPSMNFKVNTGDMRSVGTNSGAFSNTFGSATILLGTSESPTEPSVDDYVMENVDSSLTVVGNNSTVNDTKLYAANTIFTYSRTVRNDTANDITVSEIGLIIYPEGGSVYALLAREILEEPVIIAPGETVAFTFAMG